MQGKWNLDILYRGFEDEAYEADLEALSAAIAEIPNMREIIFSCFIIYHLLRFFNRRITPVATKIRHIISKIPLPSIVIAEEFATLSDMLGLAIITMPQATRNRKPKMQRASPIYFIIDSDLLS